MTKAMLRDLLAHRARVAMTLVAIVLGVTVTVAAWVASDSVIATVLGAPARSDVGIAVQGKENEPLDPAVVRGLAELPGVAGVTQVRIGRAGLVGKSGKLVATDTPSAQAGTGWDGTDRFRLTRGAAPATGEIAISTQAARGGLGVGDRARVLLADGRETTARISGVFDYRGLGTTEGEFDPVPVVAFPAGQAAAMVGSDVFRAELTMASGANVSQVRAEVTRRVGTGAAVATGAELASAGRADAAADAFDLRSTLLPFAAVALLVGMFVIANTFTMLITQRTRQFALLRAIGARRGQVRRTVVLKAVLLGLVGGTVGVLAGIALAPAMLGLFGSATALSVSPAAVLLGYLVAVVVTVLAALGAAQRAARIRPMAALRLDAALPSDLPRSRTVTGAVLVLLGTAGVLATADPSIDNLARIIGLLSAVLVVLGVLLLAPWLTRLLFDPLRRALTGHATPAVSLAVRGAARDPRRTAGTASAITIGLGLICAFGTVSATFGSLISSTILANVPARTTVLQPAAGKSDSLDEHDLAALRGLPGVTEVAGSRDRITEVSTPSGGTRLRISAIEPAALGSVLTPRLTAGTADLHRGVVVSQNQADMLGLRLHDPVTLRLPDRAVHTRVAGVYQATELSASLYYDVALAPRATPLKLIYATGQDPSAVRSTVERAFANRPDVAVTDARGLAAQGIAEQRLAFVLLYAMFGVAILIAVFGVVNTLALSVLERRREIGVLRAVGASRALVRRMIRMESVVIAVFGGLLGAVVGVATGAVMQHVMLGQQLWDLTVPFGVIGLCLAGIVLAAVLAAVWPARSAARTRMLDAIAAT